MYVYRVPKARKKKLGDMEEFEVGANKATWVGPGTVVTPDGANLWVSMVGQLWKVAREQCRSATSEEKQGIEAVMAECQDLIEQYKKGSKRAGYKDLTAEAWPPEGVEEDPDNTAPQAEERGLKRPHEDVDPPYEPSLADSQELRQAQAEAAAAEETASHNNSMEEPEQEEPGHNASTTNTSTSSSTDGTPRGEQTQAGNTGHRHPVVAPAGQIAARTAMLDPEVREMWRRSMEASDRLDGHRVRGTPLRLRYRAQQHQPYFQEAHWTFQSPEEEEDHAQQARLTYLVGQGNKAQKDFWEVDEEKKILRRHHLRKRRAAYNPAGSKDIPIPTAALGSVRSTHMKQAKGHTTRVVQDRWRDPEESGHSYTWWCGCTEFEVEDDKAIEAWVAGRKGQDDVDLRKESPEDQEEWKIQDAA